MIILNIEQQSEAWHEARCGRVTGTRFKNLVSKDTTDSYRDLVTNIACEIITNKQEETYSNSDMERGIELEPIARKEYEILFDTDVKTIGFLIPDEDHKYHEWIGISPDGVLSDNGLLEIKCPKMKTHFEYIERNELPSEYRYQVQGQLFVSGFSYCDFMSFVPNMKPFVIRVYPDVNLFHDFESRLDTLIEQVKKKLETYHKYDYSL
jgi:putative phage-type endonuclease